MEIFSEIYNCYYQIIKDILQGIDAENKEIITITDRSEAIKKAISIAEKDDAILLAGKGHETFQELGDTIIPFDDKRVAEELLTLKGLL